MLYPRAPSPGRRASVSVSTVVEFLEGEDRYGEVRACKPVPGGGLAVIFHLANAKALSGLFLLDCAAYLCRHGLLTCLSVAELGRVFRIPYTSGWL